MPDTPLALAAKYRARLDAQSEADMQRLITAYGLMSQRIKDKVDLLLLELERDPSMSVTNSARYKELVKTLGEEFAKFSYYLETELEAIEARTRTQARADTILAIVAALAAPGLMIRPEAIASAPGAPSILAPNIPSLLAPGSSAYIRLHELAGARAQLIIDALLEGIRMGYGYQQVGAMIIDALGLGLSDALRWARTIQMQTYRDEGHRTMLENSNFIDGWTWFAQLDERTCEGCSEGHGTFHGLDEELNDLTPHIWNCRCCELPHVIGDPNPITGEPTESE